MCDLALWTYIVLATISTYGALLFVGWLIRSSYRATSVYIYVTLILSGEAIRSWMGVQGRLYALANDGSFLVFSNEWYWPARNILSLAALLAIVVHMTYRIVTGKNPEVPEHWSEKIKRLFRAKVD